VIYTRVQSNSTNRLRHLWRRTCVCDREAPDLLRPGSLVLGYIYCSGDWTNERVIAVLLRMGLSPHIQVHASILEKEKSCVGSRLHDHVRGT
jgi:hypothetical protein